jgi:hypothetical protein
VVVGKIYYGDVDCLKENSPLPPHLGELETERTQFHPECNEGLLVYIKPSITGDEPQDVLNYKAGHPQFPHQPTTEQWFSESQFESYRALGWHIARRVFAPAVRELSAERETDKHLLFKQMFAEWGYSSPVGAEPHQPPTEPASREPLTPRCFQWVCR